LKISIKEKTGWLLTSVTIAKSYYGVGSLAIPWGFHLCGFQLAMLMIMVNALLSFFSCWAIVEASKFYGSRNVRTFSDLGYVCFGYWGYILVALLYFVNQAMTGIGYILFFLNQLQSILPDHSDRRIALGMLIGILVPLSCWLRSMKSISYL
jgi:amino acid permease